MTVHRGAIVAHRSGSASQLARPPSQKLHSAGILVVTRHRFRNGVRILAF